MGKRVVTKGGTTVQSYEDWKAGRSSPSQGQVVTSGGTAVQDYESWKSQQDDSPRYQALGSLYQQLRLVGAQQEQARDFYSQWQDAKSREIKGQRWRQDAQELKNTMDWLKKDMSDDQDFQKELGSIYSTLDAYLNELDANDQYWNQWESQGEYDEYQRRSKLWTNQENHLEEARGQLAIRPASDGLTEKERKKKLHQLDGQIGAIKNQMASMGRAADTPAGKAALQEAKRQLSQLQQQRKEVELGGEHSEYDSLGYDIGAAREEMSRAAGTYNPIEARGLAGADEAAMERYRKNHMDSQAAGRKLAALEQEKDWLDYVGKYDGKTYQDTFWGQSRANYTLGRMSQDSSLAWNKYLNNPTEENRRDAETIDQMLTQFQQGNEETLADDGKLPWLSKTLANYLPQFFDQAKYKMQGAALGLLTGHPLAVKVGITAGSGVYAYETMRGAAFKALLEAGVDEETARAAANDESWISALIEMGDTAIDLFTLGGGKAIDLLTKGGLKGLEKQLAKFAGKNALTKLATAGAKYGLNVFSEGLEESAQEAVSIANLGRDSSGKLDLAGEAAKTFWNAAVHGDDPNRDQIWEAGKEGMKLAAMMGVTGPINERIGSMAQDHSYRQMLGPQLDTLMADAEKLNPSDPLLAEIQKKMEAGKRVSGQDMAKLAQQTAEQTREQTLQAVQKGAQQRLTELGEAEGTDTIARAIAKEIAGERLTREEQMVLEGSQYGKQVAGEITPEVISQWVRDTPLGEVLKKQETEWGNQDVASVIQEMGIDHDNGTALMRYYKPWEGYSAAEYATTIREAFQFGEMGIPFDKLRNPAAIDNAPLKMAYNCGQLKAIETNPKMQAEGMTNGTEKVHLHPGEQWADGADPGREVSSMGQRTEAETVWEGDGQPGDGTEDFGEVPGSISTQEMGITGGTKNRRIQRYSGEETQDIREARAVARKHGLEVEFFSGGNLEVEAEGEVFEARALIQGKKIFVRADHETFSAKQLALHEAGHQQIAEGKIDIGAVYDKMVKMYGGEEMVLKAIEAYVDAYGGNLGLLTEEEIFEEILCDSVAGMNVFAQDPGGTLKKFLDNLKTTTGKRPREQATRGPPEGGAEKFSREPVSDAKKFAQEIRQWYHEGRDEDAPAFILGSTGDVLQGLGAIESDIYMLPEKINTIMHKHPEMTIETIGKIPQILEDPVLILSSNNKANDNSRLVIFGALKADNKKPVLSVLDLRAKEHHIAINDMQKVNSAYTKDGIPEHFLTSSDVLYADKKRTIPLLRSLGLTIASQELLRNGSMGRIAYRGKKVNIQGVKFREIFSSPNDVAIRKFSRETPMGAAIEKSEKLQRQQLEYWLGKPKIGYGRFAKPEDVRRVTKSVLKEYQSTMDKDEATKAMQKLADMVIREGQQSKDDFIKKGWTSEEAYERIHAAAGDIGWEIVGNSQALVNGEEMEIYGEIKSYLRTTPISIQDKADIPDFNDFRKRNFGRLRLKEGGTPIDSLWGEMQDSFGTAFFPENITHPADQLLHLEDLLNSMEPQYANPYESNLPMHAWACANDILNRLFSDAVQPVMTFQDKKLNDLSRQIREQEAAIENLRRGKQDLRLEIEELEKKNAWLKKQVGRETSSLLRENQKLQKKADAQKQELRQKTLTEQWDAKVRAGLERQKDELLRENLILQKKADDLKAEGKAKLSEYREARSATEMRNRIRKVAADLEKLLNRGTKERNVKDGLQETIGSTLNFTNLIFSDTRMYGLLKYMPESEKAAMTTRDRENREKYFALLDKRDRLKWQQKKLLQEAESSGDAWIKTEAERKALAEKLKENQKELDKLADKLQPIAERQRRLLKSKGAIKRAAQELAGVYHGLQNSEDVFLKEAYDDLVYQRILEVGDRLEETYAADMTKEQLRDVYDVLQMMQNTIRHSNKLFTMGRDQTVEESVSMIEAELAKKKKQKPYTGNTENTLDKFLWNNEKPIYAFLRMGSDTMTQLYKNLRKGEDVYAVDTDEAKEFRLKTERKYSFSSWDMEKKYSFQSNTGKEFQLTLQEIMSLYAYSKRKPAENHLLNGGFVFDPNTKRTIREGKRKKTVTTNDREAYTLTKESWGHIVNTLTREQKSFVDEMQRYLSDVMGAKGNEVSMELYGVKLFGETNYFPLHTSDVYNSRITAEQNGTTTLKNKGFSQAVNRKATSAIVLTPFMDVWADHVNEMSQYHGFVLPVEDLTKVYNHHSWGSAKDEMSATKASIQTAHGKAATDYIEQLLKDINAGKVTDPREGVMKSMTSKFKKAAVMSSASVLLRQFSAGPRAMAMIEPKYFVGRKMSQAGHKQQWEEMKQYAPIVRVKERGYFDTHMGMSARDFLLSKEYEGFGQKWDAFLHDRNFRDEVYSFGASWADEVTWIGIWNAVKRETQDTRKDLKVGSEEFLQAAGDRFTDVISMTQVYDSVFARSANMRSGTTAMGMITSFMAEPTTTINMAEHAARQFLAGDKKTGLRMIRAISASIVLDSLLGGIVYAMRDDDEEKNLTEKYIENVVGNLLNGFNILTYLPLIRDIWSIGQGYDVERADMALFNALLDSINNWGKLSMEDTSRMSPEQQEEHEKKVRSSVLQVVTGLGSFFGEPWRNIVRDVTAVWNLFNEKNYQKSTKGSLWNAAIEGAISAAPLSQIFPRESRSDKLYGAILSGDDTYRQRLESQYKDSEAASSAIVRGLRENDPRIERAAEAWNKGDFDTCLDEAEAIIASGFSENEVNRAIHAEANYLKSRDQGDEPENEEAEKKAYGLFNADAYTKVILSGNADMAKTVREQILLIEQENGKTKEDAEKSLESAVKSRLKEAYLSPETGVADWDAEKLLAEYCGMRDHEAAETVRDWNFEESHGMTYSKMLDEYKNGNIGRTEMERAMEEYGLKNYEIAEKMRSMDETTAFTDAFDMSYSEARDSYKHNEISRETMLQVLQASGKTALEAEDTLREWDIENRLGIPYSKLDDAYKYGDISREDLYNAMIENGEVPAKAEEAIQCYDWLKDRVEQYPELAISDARHFVVQVSGNCKDYTLEDFGVDVDTYLRYKEGAKDCHGVDNDGDGYADSYTKAKELFAMIDSLPISNHQKEGLAYLSNSKRTVKKFAPWN